MIQIIHYADNSVGMNIENSPDKFQVSESKFPQIDFSIHIAFALFTYTMFPHLPTNYIVH